MLRMYLLQIWFTLSDEGVEDAIYDSYAMRKFMGIDFMTEQAPDATTLLHFRRLIEESGLGKAFFDAINRCLTERGHMMKGGTIIDATLISAPSSTKNASGSRDPEMKQTKKGERMALRDEVSHRRRRGDRIYPQHRSNGGKCARRYRSGKADQT